MVKKRENGNAFLFAFFISFLLNARPWFGPLNQHLKKGGEIKLRTTQLRELKSTNTVVVA